MNWTDVAWPALIIAGVVLAMYLAVTWPMVAAGAVLGGLLAFVTILSPGHSIAIALWAIVYLLATGGL